MVSPHRIRHELYKAVAILPDPGSGGTIDIDRDGGVCSVDTTGGGARTLRQPNRVGIVGTVVLSTDGGDLTLTVEGGYNGAGDTDIVFSDAGEFVRVGSIEYDGTHYWRVIGQQEYVPPYSSEVIRPYDVSEYGAVYGSGGVEATNDAAIQAALAASLVASGNRGAYITITGHLKIAAEHGNFIDDGGVNKRIPVIIDGMGVGHVEVTSGTATAFKMYSSSDMTAHSDLVTGLDDVDGSLGWFTLPPDAGPVATNNKNQHFRLSRIAVTSIGGDCVHICDGRSHNRALLRDLFLRTLALDKVALRVDTNSYDLFAENIRISDCPVQAAVITGNNLFFSKLNIGNCGLITYGTARTDDSPSTSRIVLASDAPSADLSGYQIAIVDGTTEGDYTGVIQTYNTSTKLATVSPVFTSQPDNTSVYEVTANTDAAVLWNANGSVMIASHIENTMYLAIEVTGSRNRFEIWLEDNDYGSERVYEYREAGSPQGISNTPAVKNSGFWNQYRNLNWPTSSDQIISNATEFVYSDGGPEYATHSVLHNRDQNIDIKGMAAYESGADEGRAYWSLETLEDNADDISRSNLDDSATANSYAIFQGHTIKVRIIAGDQQYTNRKIWPFDNSTGFTGLSVPQDAMAYARIRFSLDTAGAAYFAGRVREEYNWACSLVYQFGSNYYLRRYGHAYCEGVHEVTAIGLCDAHTVTTQDFTVAATHWDVDSGNAEYFMTIHSIEFCFSYPST